MRNQYGNIPYVDGVTDAVVDAVLKDKTELVFGGSSIRILEQFADNGKMVINVFIEGV